MSALIAGGRLLSAEQSFRLGVADSVDRQALIESIVRGMHEKVVKLAKQRQRLTKGFAAGRKRR